MTAAQRPDSDVMRAARDAARKAERQARCKHTDIYSSTVTSMTGSFTTRFCWDCGKTWNTASITEFL